MARRWTPSDYERVTGKKVPPLRTDPNAGQPKPRKYHNVPTQGVLGLWFDSRQEAQRAQELWLLQQAGIITELELDKRKLRYDLLVNGVTIGTYEADARYRLRGKLIVEDTKSKATKTRQYQRTKKHMRAQYAIEITEYLVLSLQDQVVSFELAQQLQQAGVPQTAVWTYDHTGRHPHWGNPGVHYAAFTCDELITLLGERFGVLERFDDGTFGAYVPSDCGMHGRGKTPQEALGQLLLTVTRMNADKEPA